MRPLPDHVAGIEHHRLAVVLLLLWLGYALLSTLCWQRFSQHAASALCQSTPGCQQVRVDDHAIALPGHRRQPVWWLQAEPAQASTVLTQLRQQSQQQHGVVARDLLLQAAPQLRLRTQGD